MTTTKLTREQYVTSNFTAGVAEYLLSGDGFRIQDPVRGENTGSAWASIFAELEEHGYMRRSQSGQYWWTQPGQPAHS